MFASVSQHDFFHARRKIKQDESSFPLTEAEYM